MLRDLASFSTNDQDDVEDTTLQLAQMNIKPPSVEQAHDGTARPDERIMHTPAKAHPAHHTAFGLLTPPSSTGKPCSSPPGFPSKICMPLTPPDSDRKPNAYTPRPSRALSSPLTPSRKSKTSFLKPSRRTVLLTNVDPLIDPAILRDILIEHGGLRHANQNQLRSQGHVLLVWYDVRDAIVAYEKLKTETRLTLPGVPLNCRFLNRLEAMEIAPFGALSQSEGCVEIVVSPPLDVYRIQCTIQKHVGDLRGIAILEDDRRFVAELFDDRNADLAVASLDGFHHEGHTFRVALFDHDAHSQSLSHLSPLSESPVKPLVRPLSASLPLLSDPADVFGPSPTALNHNAQNRPDLPNYGTLCSDAVPPLFRIDLDAMARGLECRTTLMFRNIPNHMSRSDFRDWLDIYAAGTYGMLYLRSDFQSSKSLAYAYVDFVSPQAAASVVEQTAGIRYSIRSDKLAQLSFAKRQGLNANVEFWRNSSVMIQKEEHRPLLIYTSGPFKGYEKPFPAPNDPAKMAHSRASLSKGLFTRGNRERPQLFAPARAPFY